MKHIRKFFRSIGRAVKPPKVRTPNSEETRESDKIAGLEGRFGTAQDLKEVWSLEDEDTNITRSVKRGVSQFILPTLVFIVIVALLFWILPTWLPKLIETPEIAMYISPQDVRVYTDTSDRMVIRYVTSLMREPDVRSERITQVLFNEPVKLLSKSPTEGYVLIRTRDGLEGFVLEKDLSAMMDSIEPDMHQYKLVVSDVSKNIMSHASNGTLEIEVMMNTVLFSDQKRDGVYHVALPDGKDGWISSSGVIELGVYSPIEKVGVRYFVSSVLSFINMTHLPGGITKRGLSVPGLAYVSASVNGVALPREMADQMTSGETVTLKYDEITGDLLIDSIMPGDLVFFRHPLEIGSSTPYEMGICTETGTLIMISKSKTTLRLTSFSGNLVLQERIIAVRRIFE
ncbi:MAG: SH3 domain-containing protein [Clostridiales bacterium]|nr:SH3 domain-containing protein [Clostridiales bacterium]